MRRWVAALCFALAVSACATQPPPEASNARPWMDASLTPDARADLLLAQMTQDEKITILTGYHGTTSPSGDYQAPEGAVHGSAGYVRGVPRLGIPAQSQADAGVGVASQHSATTKMERTALPSGLAMAATWNPTVAYIGGAMIGYQARASGMNVQLAGGINLLRDPRNGRNHEYGGEDPLLAGTIVGEAVRGIQDNHMISTLKHFAFNDQETGRRNFNAIIDDGAAHMSDLLAFQIALERSHAGAVMCSYNRVNGPYACENDYLLNQLLKRDWGFRGYVMADWGGVHSTAYAVNQGLDQEPGIRLNPHFFGDKLAAALAAGEVSQARFDDMVRRVLRSMFANGLFEHPLAQAEIDFDSSGIASEDAAVHAIVLLRNENGLLPLSRDTARIAVIGGHADVGVLSGGGSSQVYPRGGNAVPGIEPTRWPGPVVYHPNPPLAEIRRLAPNAHVEFASGEDVAAAARLARASDVAIVFATQWTTETLDFSLTLPNNQDELVRRVARANPRTIVVLETGGPVFMPWLDRVGAVLEAWYPGSYGGDVIGKVLFGAINPSGRLPVTFPRSLAQLPRPQLDGEGLPANTDFDVHYSEGAAVGYKWFDARGHEPLFPFGYGLSYTRFEFSDLSAEIVDGEVEARFTMKNAGDRFGWDVAQVYVAPVAGGWEAPKRLGGWQKIGRPPGGRGRMSVRIDPRLMAMYADGHWRIAAGDYRIMLAASSRDIRETVTITLPARVLDTP